MATTPTTQATDQKLTSRIWNPGCRKYPEKRRWSTQKNVEATSIGAWPMIHRSTQKISRKHQSHMINPENTKKNTDDQPRKMSKPHQSELDPWYTNQPSKYLENIEATWLTQKNAQINPNPKPTAHHANPPLDPWYTDQSKPHPHRNKPIETTSNPSEQTALRERKGRGRKRERRGGQSWESGYAYLLSFLLCYFVSDIMLSSLIFLVDFIINLIYR